MIVRLLIECKLELKLMTNDPKKSGDADEVLEYRLIFNAFVDEFKGESDRAAVIIGTAKLDYSLYQILTKFLIPGVSNSDELLEGDSPLSTFSSRINVCYRLGIIDAKFARALHLTRRIRNSFAHEVSGGRLDLGPHRDRVRELIAPFCQTAAFKDFRKLWMHDKTGAVADFFTILALMIARLEGIFRHLPPLSQTDASTLIPSEYKTVLKDTDAASNSSDDNKFETKSNASSKAT